MPNKYCNLTVLKSVSNLLYWHEKAQHEKTSHILLNVLPQGQSRRGQGLVKSLLLTVAAIRTRLKNALKLSSAPAFQDRWRERRGLCPLVWKVIAQRPSSFPL